jgi:DNA-binding Lrp family transcriptional regulator
MQGFLGERFLSALGKGPEASPPEVLRQVRDFFDRLGILGETVSVEYEGNWYRVSCDESAFMVYRVNSDSGVRHHVPGWPVCLVNSATIFEEHHVPDLGDDHCAAGADIRRWLEIIEHHRSSSLPGSSVE